MTTNDIITGLQTLMPYYDNQNGHHTGAEHDILYAYTTDKPLSKEDIEKMIELGWHQEYDDIDYDKDFDVSDYRADEGWQSYV